jgi:hypothetical protein
VLRIDFSRDAQRDERAPIDAHRTAVVGARHKLAGAVRPRDHNASPAGTSAMRVETACSAIR